MTLISEFRRLNRESLNCEIFWLDLLDFRTTDYDCVVLRDRRFELSEIYNTSRGEEWDSLFKRIWESMKS